MRGDSFRFGFLIFASIFSIFFSINFVVAATFDECWNLTGTTSSTCSDSGGGGICTWVAAGTEDWCGDSAGCCIDLGCWQFDGTNNNTCTNTTSNGNLTCTWDSTVNIYFDNGSVEFAGACFGEFEGASSGCWQYDGDQASCSATSNVCNWKPNDANQNSWCGVKTLSDAQSMNPSASSNDIGCCEQPGCWNYDLDQSACNAAFGGLCSYDANYNFCETKWCGDVSDETNCTALKEQLFMPCEWNISGGGLCEDSYSGGGFGFFNDSDSCFDQGGWYNEAGDCNLPGEGGGFGGGEFLFSSEATCWFSDNQENMCGNLTGCAYCVAGSGPNGVSGVNASNICIGKVVGFCEGHDTSDLGSYINANNSASLYCTDIEFKSACNYGPLPNCIWNNASASTGAYCQTGTSAVQKSLPPVDFCEHPDAKNNFTLCTILSTDYLMPCVWDNSSFPVNNCTFNENAVFGLGNEKDFSLIGSESSCTAAGGTWNTEFYLDNNILKQDSWCELTGFFDIDGGGGEGNKASCDENCWACEFQINGSSWGSVGDAQTACTTSALGFCSWTAENNSFNGLGWCDYPEEMEDGGAMTCDNNCASCDFMNDPYGSCLESVASNGTGCKWVNDSSVATGYCVDKGTKTCFNDCFSCFSDNACLDSNVSCTWDDSFYLCKPQGFDGEICFDGVDNDGDTLIDCGDPDCGFDNFCGGGAFGGDCFAQENEETCNQTIAFGSDNCVWINDTWNPNGWCDMPGANCWQFDDDLIACGNEAGCTNTTTLSGGFCDLNFTTMNTADCWGNSNEGDCTGASGCQWTNDSFNSSVGWCDYAPFSVCYQNANESSCTTNTNCTWTEDPFSDIGGWCDIACFNHDLNSTQCADSGSGNLCEFRDLANTCQPSTFVFFATGGTGGQSGCWQFDGNETGCGLNSVTCVYLNDSFVGNNVSASEPSGWCMDKSEFEHFGNADAPPIILSVDSGNLGGAAEDGVDDLVDIKGMGMKVSDEAFNFGGEIINITNSMMCNGYKIGRQGTLTSEVGNGNETTNFYWYLDTDGNNTGQCSAVYQNGSTSPGYDFLIGYSVRNTSDGVVETKQMKRCSGDSGVWTLTNALVTTSKKLSCSEIGGVMIAIDKDDLDAFDTFDESKVMRVFMSSANGTGNRTSPTDSLPAGYYTPGTIDFNFVDCSDPDTTDPKCKNIQKFGFNIFEECLNGIDDNEDGLIDCADPICAFAPSCGAGFSFVANSSDITAPIVTFSEVDVLHDATFIRIDTDGPSNLSLAFYGNDSSCLNVNITITDTVDTGYQKNANFKPFHDIDLIGDELGFDLANGTTYFYKTTTCDPSNNCAVSACSNFTTKSSAVDKVFIFKIDLPDGYTVDIPAFNLTGYNFTTSFGTPPIIYDIGIKTNTSVTKNMNITFHSNCAGLSLGFFGINVYEPLSIDLTNAFICDSSTNSIGMNSTLKKWNKLIDELNLGGASDYIKVILPLGYNVSNNFTWSDDDGGNSQNVSAFVECSGNSTQTECNVPVSLGFSLASGTKAPTPEPPVEDTTPSTDPVSTGPGVNTTTNATTTENETTTEDTDVATEDVAGDGEVVYEDEEEEKGWFGFVIVLGILIGIGIVGFVGKYFVSNYMKYRTV
ncbi:MAG: hypothetical protein IH845_04700 [Nanoarchaeota archaeon]|nr:hypothetical protein [Nanoarchaeota archaeon]